MNCEAKEMLGKDCAAESDCDIDVKADGRLVRTWHLCEQHSVELAESFQPDRVEAEGSDGRTLILEKA